MCFLLKYSLIRKKNQFALVSSYSRVGLSDHKASSNTYHNPPTPITPQCIAQQLVAYWCYVPHKYEYVIRQQSTRYSSYLRGSVSVVWEGISASVTQHWRDHHGRAFASVVYTNETALLHTIGFARFFALTILCNL